MARILFITTKQPSTNPRMRKSADTLADAGHEVHVLYAFNTPWADEADEKILKQVPWSFERIGGHPNDSRLIFHTTRATRKIYALVGNVKRNLCRGYTTYIRQGRRWNPDLIIGHNPGALGPISALGSQLEIPILFDAEDYHRGETAQETVASKLVTHLEDETLPNLRTITAASPLISRAYKALYPHLQIYTVNNAFPTEYLQQQPSRSASALSIAWFSQVVGLDRGLEEFLDSLQFLQDVQLTIHIIGLCKPEIQRQVNIKATQHGHRIKFSPPIPEKSLFSFLSGIDLGLALERTSPQNRDICRTNKVYTYPLAGCYTLFSRTSAQIHFYQEYPDAGELIDLSSPESIAHVIRTLDANRDDLIEKRKKAWSLAKDHLNWEKESKQLIEVVNSTLKQ